MLGIKESQAEELRKKFGSNAIKPKEKKTFRKILWETVAGDAIIKILIFALVINAVFAVLGYVKYYEPMGIFVALVLATVLGAVSEFSAEGQFRSLQEKASRIYVKVYRDGKLKEILIDDIVKGDYILLQSGDKVPCDGYLFEGSAELNLAALNGETKPAKKFVRENTDWETYWAGNEDNEEDSPLLNPYKLFREAVVSDGKAVMIAHKVGAETLIGKTASQDTEEPESPLSLKLNNLAKQISVFGYIASALVIIFIMLADIKTSGGLGSYFVLANTGRILADLLDAVIMAIIIIVVAVPEGLPLMTMLVLSLNMKKLLSDNVLVRKLTGIETAGSLNVLYSDKTGTITKGVLEVVTFFGGSLKNYDSFSDIPHPVREKISLAINCNSSCQIDTDENGTPFAIGGNHTEKAVSLWAYNTEFTHNIEKKETVLFNSKHKFSAQRVKGDFNGVLIKGAPEVVKNCHWCIDPKGNKKLITKDMAEAFVSKIDALASKQIRVLAIAICDEEVGEFTHENILGAKLTLLGFVGIRDDIRKEAAPAVKRLQGAGVQVIMITGDRKETAQAIAKEVGIIKNDTDIVLTSYELNQMSDEEVLKIIPRLRVIARALPQDKFRLVGLTQSLGNVVGMTGDGVNDAPALERSDVGFGMGSGTETAKEAANIVILDDNISSIAKAVLYGRTIFNSIRRFIVFQLTVNVSAVLVNLLGPVLSSLINNSHLKEVLNQPLTVTQMLWVNLVMDTIAAIAFGLEATQERYMREKPKRRDENIISKSMLFAILFDGCYLTLASFLLFVVPYIWYMLTGDHAVDTVDEAKYFTTVFFTFYIFSIIFNMFNSRTESPNVLQNMKHNPGFLAVVACIFLIQIFLIYFGGPIFSCYGLECIHILWILGLSFFIVPIDILRKFIFNYFLRHIYRAEKEY